jgi:DNA invertase Pin-like site-specific DNA recombinase
MTSDTQQKAYSYLRFSTTEQMKGDSFRRQSRQAREYAQFRGLELDEHSFEDLGISAYQGRNKEVGALGLFLEAAEEGVVPAGSYLLVESLDRLSRQSPRKAARVIEDICKKGITVVTLFDGREYDLNALDHDPMTFIMMVLIFQRANEESTTKARRLRSAWEGKRKRIADGEAVRLTSRAPKWLRPADDGVSFEVVPERGEVVRRIFMLTLEGTGKNAIAESLNREGVPVFGNGKLWHPSYVSKILNNPSTYGTLIPFSSNPEKKSDRTPHEAVEGYYPQVIDRETFERIQALKSSRSPRRGRHSEVPLQNMLGGLAVCPLCGNTMARVSKNAAKGWVYLICQKARGGAGCQYNSVRYDLIEPAVHAQLGQLIADCPKGDDSLDQQILEVRNNLEGVDNSVSNILESLEQGLSVQQHPVIGERLEGLQGQSDELKEELLELLQRHTTFSGDMAIRRATNLGNVIVNHPEDKVRINSHMRECFSKVVVDFQSGDLVFHWKHGGQTSIMYKFPVLEGDN